MKTKRVLFVTAHPDDIDVFFAGTIAKLRNRKIDCFFQILTSGDMSGTNMDKATLVKTREKEQLDSLSVAGITGDHARFAGLKDGFIESNTDTIGHVVQAIRYWKPEVVCTFDPRTLIVNSKYIMHRDHRNCGQAAIDAVYPYARIDPFFPEYGPAFSVKSILLADPLEANTEVDITREIEVKRKMLSCHKSQWDKKLVEKLIRDNKVDQKYKEVFGYYQLGW
jgi:LmbE family N-acetylglucosaminyl deacetylase